MLSFVLSGQLNVRLYLSCFRTFHGYFFIAGVTLQSDSGLLNLSAKLAGN